VNANRSATRIWGPRTVHSLPASFGTQGPVPPLPPIYRLDGPSVEFFFLIDVRPLSDWNPGHPEFPGRAEQRASMAERPWTYNAVRRTQWKVAPKVTGRNFETVHGFEYLTRGWAGFATLAGFSGGGAVELFTQRFWEGTSYRGFRVVGNTKFYVQDATDFRPHSDVNLGLRLEMRINLGEGE